MAKKVKVGDRSIDEASLLVELANIKKKIEAWATQNELWHDSSFATPFLYHDEVPGRHDTLLLVSEGPIARVLCGDGDYTYQTAFESMLEKLGYWYEPENHYSFYSSPHR